jgi:hypothetical protein
MNEPHIIRRHPEGGYSLIGTEKGPVPADFPHRHFTVRDALRVAEQLYPGEDVQVDPACYGEVSE